MLLAGHVWLSDCELRHVSPLLTLLYPVVPSVTASVSVRCKSPVQSMAHYLLNY